MLGGRVSPELSTKLKLIMTNVASHRLEFIAQILHGLEPVGQTLDVAGGG